MRPASALEVLHALCLRTEEALASPALLIVAAHPDDEVIGAGSRLRRLRQHTFVHTTDGSPQDLGDAQRAGFSRREDYAQARRREVEAVLGEIGATPGQGIVLPFVDQEASFHLAELSRRIEQLIEEKGIGAILTQPYEGGHPDHDATAFAVHVAAALVRQQGREPPVILEMTGYHNGPEGIRFGEFLPAEHAAETMIVLTEEERAFKRRLIECYRTQLYLLQNYPLERERLRVAPSYNFTQPPHPGPLHYERFNWGVTGPRWRELAAAALAELGIQGRI